MRKLLLITSVLMLGLAISQGPASARRITDMTGRKVTVPDTITRVYATAPPATYLVYAVARDMLVGLNTPYRKTGGRYLDPRLKTLPVLGGWFGQGRMANLESLMRARPDVVVAFRWLGRATPWKIEETLGPLGLPVVSVVIKGLEDYPRLFRFLGDLLGRRERGEALARYAEKVLAELAALRKHIPPDQRLSVYYAEGAQGLRTECHGSFHAELITLCGAVNPHRCLSRTIYGMDKVSLEQVLAYNPQVILSHDSMFLKALPKDRRWNGVRALTSGRVYPIPTVPLNWFDRPPSFMRLLGAQWLAQRLYPDRYAVDLVARTREFFGLFLGAKLDAGAAKALLGR